MRTLVLSVAICSVAIAADRPEADIIKDIAAAKKTLLELEKELLAAKKIQPIKLNARTIEVGAVGKFADDDGDAEMCIDEVTNATQMTVRIKTNPSLKVHVDNFPTAGLGRGKILKDPPLWVVKHSNWGSDGLYMITPFLAEPKPEPKPKPPAKKKP